MSDAHRGVVRAVPVSRALRDAASARRSELWPSPESIEACRHLARRFPDAGLVPLRLLRAPTLEAHDTGRSPRRRVWLAAESLQVTGSFKVRGALVALDRLRGEGAKEVVAASAGNHGVGVAHGASVLGMKATVVVPASAPVAKRSKLAALGAELIVHESASYDAAERFAVELAARRGTPFLSPYDDVDVVAGNGASLALEICAALGGAPAQVFAPFGGGGLASGLAAGLFHEDADADGRVWGVQSEASPAMALSIDAASARVTFEGAATLAEGLEGGISARGFERACASVAGVCVVSEQAIGDAMVESLLAYGLAIEGSAACGLVPVKASHAVVESDGDVVVVVTGRNVDGERLRSVLAASPRRS